MTTRLPDRGASDLLLIGASRFASDDLGDLPAVANNITDLARLLTDPVHGVIAADRCRVLRDPDAPHEVGEALDETVDAATDTVVVYYAGHGLLTPRGELHLAVGNTRPDRVGYTAVPIDWIRTALADSVADNRILILDCCFSGRATNAMTSLSSAVTAAVDISGTYTVTSAPANSAAMAVPGETHTAFTGALLDVLGGGVPGAGDPLSLRDIYVALVRALQARNMPRPQQLGTGLVDLLALGRNRAAAAPPVPPEPPVPPVPVIDPVAVPPARGSAPLPEPYLSPLGCTLIPLSVREPHLVGDTARSPGEPWTATVHAFLRHLEYVGFTGAPRALGVDEKGNSVTSHLAGEIATYPLAPHWVTDEALDAVARMLRLFHDAQLGFRPPPDPDWPGPFPAAGPDAEVVCHHEVAPHNVVWRPDGTLAMTNFGITAPGSRMSDVAYAAWNWVPLFGDADAYRLGWRLLDRPRRLRMFADAYGLTPDDRHRLVRSVRQRIVDHVDVMQRLFHAGLPGYREAMVGGAARRPLRDLRLVDHERVVLEHALR